MVAIAIGLVDSNRPLGGIVCVWGIPLSLFRSASWLDTRKFGRKQEQPYGCPSRRQKRKHSQPANVRDSYSPLGAYVVLDPKGINAHDLRVSRFGGGVPEHWKFFRTVSPGQEVFGTDHAQMTTRRALGLGDRKSGFVMIKDEKGRHTDSPLWATVGGWALFKSDRRISKWQPTIRKTASDATSRAADGLDLRPRLSSSRRKVTRAKSGELKLIYQNDLKEMAECERFCWWWYIGLGVAAASSLRLFESGRGWLVTNNGGVRFGRKMKLPVGYRRWVFIGAP